MNARTLYVLIAAAVVAVAAAIGLHAWQQPKTEVDEQAKPLLPTLRDHVNDVSSVKVTGAGGTVIATLNREREGWGIGERAGYPADVSKLRDFLIKLDRATLIDAKTDSPKRYSDIGVGDVKDAQAKGVLVELSGLSGPVALIVGDYSAPSGGTFVRREGEASSWLASGNPDSGENRHRLGTTRTGRHHAEPNRVDRAAFTRRENAHDVEAATQRPELRDRRYTERTRSEPRRRYHAERHTVRHENR